MRFLPCILKYTRTACSRQPVAVDPATARRLHRSSVPLLPCSTGRLRQAVHKGGTLPGMAGGKGGWGWVSREWHKGQRSLLGRVVLAKVDLLSVRLPTVTILSLRFFTDEAGTRTRFQLAAVELGWSRYGPCSVSWLGYFGFENPLVSSSVVGLPAGTLMAQFCAGLMAQFCARLIGEN